MAPPSKAVKSDLTLKTYTITRDLRRHIDNGDRNEAERGYELNEALSKARELVKYLSSKIDEREMIAASNERIRINGE